MKLYTGCSGLSYFEWAGRFYPAGLPQSQWLRFYATHFDTLEINSTFYKFPTEKSLAKWYHDTPADFSFVVKAPKYFTHISRMTEVKDELENFYAVTENGLREKLRCYLFQFPASVAYSAELLQAILNQCTAGTLHCFEFRHISWFSAAIWEALQAAGHLFCNVSLPGFPDVFIPDARHSYFRFHGKPVLYKSAYGSQGLHPWIAELEVQPSQTVFALFNNTWYADAVADAHIWQQQVQLLQHS